MSHEPERQESGSDQIPGPSKITSKGAIPKIRKPEKEEKKGKKKGKEQVAAGISDKRKVMSPKDSEDVNLTYLADQTQYPVKSVVSFKGTDGRNYTVSAFDMPECHRDEEDDKELEDTTSD